MSISDVETALIQNYVDGSFNLPTAYENRMFSPADGKPWAAVSFIPNQPVVASIGPTGSDEHTGILQIDLYYPVNTGTGQCRDKAQEVMDAYKAGSDVEYNGQHVIITSCGRSTGRAANGWYRVIITVEWYAHINR